MKTIKQLLQESKRVKRLDLEKSLIKTKLDWTITKDDVKGFTVRVNNVKADDLRAVEGAFSKLRDVISRDFNIKLHSNTIKNNSLNMTFNY